MVYSEISNCYGTTSSFAISFKTQTLLPKSRIYISLPKIERLHKMTVGINNTRHTFAPLVDVQALARRRKPAQLVKKFVWLIRRR